MTFHLKKKKLRAPGMIYFVKFRSHAEMKIVDNKLIRRQLNFNKFIKIT